MKSLSLPCRSLLLFLLPVALLGAPAHAAEKSPAELLPDSTVLYFELSNPQKLLHLVFDHPLYKQFTELDEVKNNPQLAEGKAALAAFEQKMGMPWRQAVEAITAHGVTIAVDPATKGVVTLAHARDAQTAAKFRDTVIAFARDAAANEGRPDPVKEAQYRGETAHQIDQGIMAAVGPWLLVTNSGDLGKRIIDARNGDNAFTLAADRDYQAARATAKDDAAGWAFLRIRTLRDLGVAADLYRNRSDDAGAELLLGGLFHALRGAEYITAEVHAGESDLRLSLIIPHDDATLPEPRRFFFSPDAAKGSAARPLKPEGTILAISAYRDLGKFWLAAPDLLTEEAAAKLAQSDADISRFFSGRDFGREILGAIEPRWQIIIARQPFTQEGRPVPAIKLPAFALIFETNNPQLIHPYAQVIHTLAVTFINIGGMQQGYPVMIQNQEKHGSATLFTADYLPQPEMKNRMDADINYNISPTVALVGNHVMICSSRSIAQQVAALAAKQTGQTPLVQENTLIEVHPAPIVQGLKDNREQLIAQNMLKKGIDQAVSAMQIDALLKALQYVKGADLKLVPDGKTLRLEFGLSVQTPNTSQ